jgi:hypothetical protein
MCGSLSVFVRVCLFVYLVGDKEVGGKTSSFFNREESLKRSVVSAYCIYDLRILDQRKKK